MSTFLSLANDHIVTVNVCTSSSQITSVEIETNRGLYCLSDGTLRDIIKLNNRRMPNDKLSTALLSRAKLIYRCATNIGMTFSEKEAQLPTSLKDRGRGNMIFPKSEMLTFVREVYEATVQYLNADSFRKY